MEKPLFAFAEEKVTLAIKRYYTILRYEINKDYVDFVGKILVMDGTIEKESALINDTYQTIYWICLNIIKKFLSWLSVLLLTGSIV